MIRVFLSYRRFDTAQAAGRLADELRRQFGKDSVFKDVDSIPKGMNWRRRIDKHMAQTDVLLVLIGDRWLGDEGGERLSDPNDMVSYEVQIALNSNIPIVPVLVDNAALPPEESLPKSFSTLSTRQAAPLRDADFSYDFQNLMDGIKSLVVPKDFTQWLHRYYRTRTVLIPGFAILLLMIFAGLELGYKLLSDITLRAIALNSYHLLVVFLLLVFFLPFPRVSLTLSNRAAQAVAQFLQAWRMLWASWVLLYLVFTVRAIVEYRALGHQHPAWVLCLDLFNNFQTVTLVMCYLVVTKKTVDQRDSVSALESKTPLPWLNWFILLILFAVFELVVLLTAYQTGAERVLKYATDGFRLFSGFFSGVAMALLIGRLDSKFINPPTAIIFLMYTYAIIQPTWAIFSLANEKGLESVLYSREFELLILGLALILKCILFVLMAWLFQSGILFFYLERLAFLIENVGRQRHEYLGQLWHQSLEKETDDPRVSSEDSNRNENLGRHS